MNLHRIALSIVASAFMLSACASTPSSGGSAPAPQSLQSALQQLGQFTLTDLQNADAIAQAQTPPDQIGHTCYVGLEQFVMNQQAVVGPNVTVSGAFSALEAGRAALSTANNLTSSLGPTIKNLELACVPLVIDTQNNAILFLGSLAAFGVKP
jgi:hypothetical protein